MQASPLKRPLQFVLTYNDTKLLPSFTKFFQTSLGIEEAKYAESTEL